MMRLVTRLSAGRATLLRFLLLPGIILHEAAHVIACAVTLTRIRGFSVWEPDGGGRVQSDAVRFPLILGPVVSLAPLPAGLLAMHSLSQLIVLRNWVLSAAILYLMVSIAATLAPSGQDFRSCIAGVLLAMAVGICVLSVSERSLTTAAYIANGFLPVLVQINLILASMTIISFAATRAVRAT